MCVCARASEPFDGFLFLRTYGFGCCRRIRLVVVAVVVIVVALSLSSRSAIYARCSLFVVRCMAGAVHTLKTDEANYGRQQRHTILAYAACVCMDFVLFSAAFFVNFISFVAKRFYALATHVCLDVMDVCARPLNAYGKL